MKKYLFILLFVWGICSACQVMAADVICNIDGDFSKADKCNVQDVGAKMGSPLIDSKK
ncbi:MAG: hypothetical protein IJC11_04020 [Alphaproteobacteria bacterium]|nr:hypothetical protein [Alphaproteobacteria bacterium]MBQ6854473.1 hypothetical protein [Alphaproteobacteria bacterium]MBR3913539.1 hypothetical protein [Alphaproteobacteria bacterium]